MGGSPFLDVDIPITFQDHPGIQSALLYTEIHLCNLNCFKCHNRASYKEKTAKLSYEELKEKLSMLKLLGVELIIISGGEPTLEKDLENGLKVIKSFGFPVRVDTNGTNPDVVEKLIKSELVDGFAVDVKIPIKNEYTPLELERFKTILFSDFQLDDAVVYEYANKLRITIDIIKRYSLPYTLFRTVDYPLLKNEDKEAIKEVLKSLPHQFNPFYNVEE
ncbi:MAG: radical SAM protein [Desulfurobacteriaceae bacterium]